MITRETIEDFFDNTRKLRDEGRAQFNIDSTCRWSFFFVDSNKEKLIHKQKAERGHILLYDISMLIFNL